jgi:hypothetical protein
MIDAPLPPDGLLADEDLYGESVEEFVGEEDTVERGQFVFVRDVGEITGPRGERLLLAGAEAGKGFDDEDARQWSAPCREDVGEKLSVVGPLFDESEVAGVPQVFPHLEELRREKFSEDRTNAHAGEKISTLPGARPVRGVIPPARMVERDSHEFVEADGSVPRDAGAEFVRGSVRAG